MPDEGGSGNGGSGEGSGAGSGSSESLERRLEQAFENLARRQGGQDAAGILLLQENHGYRERIRELEDQVRSLESQVPSEGALVLSSEDAERWQAYGELGTPDDIRQQRDRAQELERRQLLADVAEAAGYKVPVLERLANGLTVELRDEQREGQTIRVPYVVPEEGTAVSLSEYAQENWADFMPALTAEQADGNKPRVFVTQTPAATGGSKDMAQEFLESQEAKEKERKNPLMR
jgi:hypothetical protein